MLSNGAPAHAHWAGRHRQDTPRAAGRGPGSSAHGATVSSGCRSSVCRTRAPRLGDCTDDRRARRPCGFLRGRQLLLLLDNFEHLLDAAPGVGAVLGAGTSVRALVTSQAPLRVAGEQEYRLEPLPIDGSRRALRRAGTRGRARGRARPHGRGDLPAPGRAPARRQARCGEFAPAPARLLERLDSALPLLTGGARDAHERQPHPPRDDRVELRPARLERPGAVRAPLGVHEHLLARRCRGHLRRRPRRPGRPRRLQPSEDGRRRPIPDAGDDPRVRPRAAGGRAGSSGGGTHSISPPSPSMRSPALRRGGRGWSTRLDVDHDDLRAALDWLEMHDVDAAVELSERLGRFWLSRGLLEEGARASLGCTFGVGAGSRSRSRANRVGALTARRGDASLVGSSSRRRSSYGANWAKGTSSPRPSIRSAGLSSTTPATRPRRSRR